MNILIAVLIVAVVIYWIELIILYHLIRFESATDQKWLRLYFCRLSSFCFIHDGLYFNLL